MPPLHNLQDHSRTQEPDFVNVEKYLVPHASRHDNRARMRRSREVAETIASDTIAHVAGSGL
jgi:hypothetical protein